ncbi:hypothetical protein PF005_g27228 [Phytophthora fragariae]|uniref:HTH CENPB-type domain-containing protein n=1 Tax=Phytophthora fragariae TaxID=53985 RepID=A0A6A3DPW5_9STRA|nr:hypothetical protein PF003_g32150 [Phytophthora fragariae]KAE8922513.1 hypothetical protein PF009_g27225 [Phytophthora fragariae]KAE9077060.1 hypothetical protein PF007_g24387 [Phytophthora fragariae]KAE9101650.1 hypothetical protein PF006_g22620 [Phytophthora fragariae]KAE9171232.1 hypothetical protein PF005_g27228 [Phytophthora fragariae]
MTTSPPRPYRRRSHFTKLQALQISERRRQVLTATYKELAAWAQAKFSLAPPPSKQTIGRALKSESQLRCATADCLMSQRGRPSFQLVLDRCMIEFVLASESWGIPLSGSMLIAQSRKALQRLNVPPASWPRLGRSWFRNFQDRYRIRWRRAHGEDGLVDLDAVEEEVAELRRLICTYSFTDVYNMDETGFFFINVPRGSLCVSSAPALKQDKARITLALCTNASGTDKLPLLFIGKSVKPRWLAKKLADV